MYFIMYWNSGIGLAEPLKSLGKGLLTKGIVSLLTSQLMKQVSPLHRDLL